MASPQQAADKFSSFAQRAELLAAELTVLQRRVALTQPADSAALTAAASAAFSCAALCSFLEERARAAAPESGGASQ
jgi:hypothetical protein